MGITPRDTPAVPDRYAMVAVQPMDIAAPLADGEIAAAFGAAGVAAGDETSVYPSGPRQEESRVLVESPQGFASGGYDIISGYHEGGGDGWPNDVEPVTDGP